VSDCLSKSTYVCACDLLLMLLCRKRKLLTRDDLQLPWLPVYKLFQEVFYAKELKMGMKNYAR